MYKPIQLSPEEIPTTHRRAFRASGLIGSITDLRGRRFKRLLTRPMAVLNEGWQCEPAPGDGNFAYRIGSPEGNHQTLRLETTERRLTLTSVHINSERRAVRHTILYCLERNEVVENGYRYS